jgi:hypothetical protein
VLARLQLAHDLAALIAQFALGDFPHVGYCSTLCYRSQQPTF